MREKVKHYSVEIRCNAATGEITSEMWYESETGLPHRCDGPAKTVYVEHEGLRKRSEFYFQRGLEHRSGDEPALISTVIDTGVQVQRTWIKNGKYHRGNGLPAIIHCDPETGAVTHEEYYVEGKRHRENGPAFILRNRVSGIVKEEKYFLNGEQIGKPVGAKSSFNLEP